MEKKIYNFIKWILHFLLLQLFTLSLQCHIPKTNATKTAVIQTCYTLAFQTAYVYVL